MRVHGTRQTGFFTKVPNATARDHGLSFAARGLLAYLLSLPDGAREDVKTLANKSVEGRGVITRALNELESRGYMTRAKTRDDDGRIHTQVEVFADRGGASRPVVPAPVSPGTGTPGGGKSGIKTEETGVEDSLPPQVPLTDPVADTSASGRAGGELSRALSLLVQVAKDEPRLHLAAGEAGELAALVDRWLARGATPGHVTSALTSGLPPRVHQAAALVRHRLTAKMPPERSKQALGVTWHECAECRVPMRAEGLCGDCSHAGPQAAPTALRKGGRVGFELARAQLR
ncbi:conserved hypothetical protein [Catenulispora acidiphila DSM 44928]|uniref:Helix-turn-helix domain-containing protein n=1 Tax=Catenulispora acidiphila (strain DSM 44928 / JCM 14897 / NBRC 102108 / NRRL B-24433 / ID139908) TaxID=479433 RepID=C7PYT8_CATAD|nr:helix-turn-helix domain-containing protein [Catenulispora acidiphila]ACU77410.1 conserved hypothetical protein [Catenulispora acidiphila DSM 44928]